MNPQDKNQQPQPNNLSGDPINQSPQSENPQFVQGQPAMPSEPEQQPPSSTMPQVQSQQSAGTDPFPPPFQPPTTPQQSPVQAQQQTYQQPQQPEIHQEFGQTVQYGIQQPKSSKKKMFIVLAVVFVILIGAAGVFAAMTSSKKEVVTEKPKQNSSVAKPQVEKKTVEIPSDWESIPTELGFSISGPAGWATGVSAGSTFANLKSTNILVSGQETADEDGAEQGGGLLPPEDSVSISVQERTDAKGQKAFESIVTKLNEESLAVLESFGVKREDIKISHKNIEINGVKWLEVSTDIPGQMSRNLYLWDGNQAIAVTVTAADKDTLQKIADKYLYPVAASVEKDE